MNPQQATAHLAFFRTVCGARNVRADPQDQAPYLEERRGRFSGSALAVVLPGSTAEVAAVVQYAQAHGIAIVPQGGQTGLCGGALPDASGHQIVLNLKRMRRIVALDPVEATVTVEAGCRLSEVQAAADAAGLWFPLSLASAGECQIGGNLATNAGGHNVLRYGNVRELCLGMEVVLADGRVWSDLKGLHKDNSGYDLKQLFIGAEGTLGVITAAVLRLLPRPVEQITAQVAVSGPVAALRLFERVNGAIGGCLTAFELMSAFSLELVARHFPDLPARQLEASPWNVLLELSGTSSDMGLSDRLSRILDAALRASEIRDAVIARNTSQGTRLWAVRNAIPDAQRREGPSIKHDIALPRARIASFIEEMLPILENRCPGVRPCVFGHLGDGNLHFNLSLPRGAEAGAFLAQREALERLVYDHVVAQGGTFSAEHGIGQLKRGEMARYKDAVTLDLMRILKHALDPSNLMNPGKLLPDP